MKFQEFIKGINVLLTSKLTGVSVYTRETTQGYSFPCIFTEVIPDIITPENKSMELKNMQIRLTYMNTKRDDVVYFTIIDSMHNIFKKTIKIKTPDTTRVLHINSFDYDFVGDNEEYIEFNIVTRFYDIEEVVENTDNIEEVNLDFVGG